MDPHKDYYKILQVQESATKEEIKASYRSLVKKYHPDRNPSNTEDCDEILKELNEAYEVLGDENSKFVYDQYRKETKQNKDADTAPEEKQEPATENTSYQTKNRRTYIKKKTVSKERRVYVSGDMTAKFWGANQDELTHSLFETHYRINANDVSVVILEEDIFPLSTPPDKYKSFYSEADLFKTPLAQPIKCTIQNEGRQDFYKLIIKDIRVADPVITDVVKHEGQAFGTIKGKLYGYIQHFEYSDVYEEVTECFGETGNVEYKTEDGRDQYRKEYYHKDCTTYWGNWINVPVKKKTVPVTTTAFDYDGCGNYLWILLLIPLMMFAPQILLWLIPTALIILLLYFGSTVSGVVVPFFRIAGIILFLIFLFFGLRSLFVMPKGNESKPKQQAEKGIVRRTYKDVAKSKEPGKDRDSLISNFIQWFGYDSVQYSTTLSISERDLRLSSLFHRNLNIEFTRKEDISEVYRSLEAEDSNKLHYVYLAFDSLKINYGLDRPGFANAIVSCVQAFHYSLVFDKSCDNYDASDPFVTSFLASCNKDCCVGYEKYGVRSPVEFISDLNGDCDTRTLLLFTILSHYGYHVALLTSVEYKHSLLALSPDEDESPAGTGMYINDRKYLFWETTGPGWKSGVIPTYLTNLNNWDITLLSD